MQSYTGECGPALHVAIIMDGNGRWATRRGLPRACGHAAGIEALARVTEASARDPAIGTLTVFAFSADNWRRPPDEVAALMGLLGRYLRERTDELVRDGVEFVTIGRRDRLPAGLPDAIATAENRTRGGRALRLAVAIDYSARAALSGSEPGGRPGTRDRLAPSALPDVDLMIRTGGEKRLSDFLLWEAAYAELVFTDTAWPDFGPDDLTAALAEFRARDRRFGGLPAAPVPPASARITGPALAR